VPGSIEELEERSGTKVMDLHKPVIDEVVVKCAECDESAHRVSEVLDSWIEAGSAPYGERHYPFGQETDLAKFFPPDFIVEYTGQIRAWFYVLHVISNSLFETNAFKNVVVNGVILGTDGRKMSKNFGNYPDPKEMLQKYGGDALRLYFMASPVMRGEDIVISEEEYKNQIRATLLPIINIYSFFAMYANTTNWTPSGKPLDSQELHILDSWILSRLGSLEKITTDSLNAYDTATAITALREFVDDWSKWYIRRSRDRVGEAFYETTYYVLTNFAKLVAPVIPFTAEFLYKRLTTDESVHLQDWPDQNAQYINKGLEKSMALARSLVEEGHAFRKKNALKVRKPLLNIVLEARADVESIPDAIWDVVLDELNIKNITVGDFNYPKIPVVVSQQELDDEEAVRDLIRTIQQERKTLGLLPGDKITLVLPEFPKKFEDLIAKKVLATSIETGEKLLVAKV
ncbi:MAG: class I tRNA ligase family protein, partial [Microgenomates group bacterium]